LFSVYIVEYTISHLVWATVIGKQSLADVHVANYSSYKTPIKTFSLSLIDHILRMIAFIHTLH